MAERFTSKFLSMVEVESEKDNKLANITLLHST